MLRFLAISRVDCFPSNAICIFCKFLYEFLSERQPIENISHKQMPTFREHVKFINSTPYSKWYIINYDDQKIGTIYLSKQNEIGIHLKKDFSSLLKY